MAKPLSKLNVILYALLFCLTIWYFGHELFEYLIEWSHHIWTKYKSNRFGVISRWLSVVQYPVIYFIIFQRSRYIAKELHYSTQYFWAAIPPLAYISIVWGFISLKDYRTQYRFSDDTDLDLVIIPAVLFGVTLLAFINYTICAVQAKKQLGY